MRTIGRIISDVILENFQIVQIPSKDNRYGITSKKISFNKQQEKGQNTYKRDRCRCMRP